MTEEKRKQIIDKINYDYESGSNCFNGVYKNAKKPELILETFCKELDNLQYREECSHDLWIYIGSFKKNPNSKYEEYFDGYIPCNEDSIELAFNKYMCIECGKIQCVKDYKSFENNHCILKGKKEFLYELYKNAFRLQIMYYRHLYEMNSNSALDIIKKENNSLLLIK